MLQMKVILIDCEDSYTLNIFDYLSQNGLEVVVKNYREIEIAEIGNYDAIVLSPGPNSPNQVPILFDILKTYADQKPILGICLGHQAIGMYYGHALVRSKQPMHGISVKIFELKGPIFHTIDNEILMVMRYNSLAVEDNEDSELEVIARDESREIMAFQHKSLPIFSFQFHPESVGTPQGLKLIENWKKQLITHN